MKKVYVVSEGNYSAYYILGIFSSKDKANTFALSRIDSHLFTDVEEFVIDEKE